MPLIEGYDQMKLEDYLDEIKYAVSRVIESIWHERVEAAALREEIDRLRKVAEENYSKAQYIQETAEDPDDVMLGVGIHWDTYFGEDKQQYYKTEELSVLVEKLATRDFSVSSLAGSLLQYAKQGLSAAYGKAGDWPNGRTVGSQSLKTIILAGRNQSEHWEEGDPGNAVKECFSILKAEFGEQFAFYDERNLAFELVDLLGWRSFDSFKADLLAMDVERE